MERPIIRQAVAFSADPPTQVPVATYEANVTKPKKPHFLPGQEVPLPSKSKVSKRNKTGIKRPRRPDAYPGQTTRFRLETYDPTPTTDPPIAHGSGPYSSMYRGVAPSVPVQTQGGPGMHHDSVMAPSALPLLVGMLVGSAGDTLIFGPSRVYVPELDASLDPA